MCTQVSMNSNRPRSSFNKMFLNEEKLETLEQLINNVNKWDLIVIWIRC